MLKSQLKIYMFFVIFLYFYTPKNGIGSGNANHDHWLSQ
jgi:hypothetical protein